MYHYLLSFFLYHPSSFYVVFVTFDANCHSQKRQFFILALCTSILHRFLFFKFCQNKAMLQCNGPHGLRKDDGAHWTYQLQILSELCFQRLALSGNYEIVAFMTEKKTHFFNDLDYKADIEQHFHKSGKSARGRHCHKIIKKILKLVYIGY